MKLTKDNLDSFIFVKSKAVHKNSRDRYLILFQRNKKHDIVETTKIGYWLEPNGELTRMSSWSLETCIGAYKNYPTLTKDKVLVWLMQNGNYDD